MQKNPDKSPESSKLDAAVEEELANPHVHGHIGERFFSNLSSLVEHGYLFKIQKQMN